jgi:hypothetical protein
LSSRPFPLRHGTGKSYTLPKVGVPENVDGNAERVSIPKGYGKGLISVDTVSIADFNANPDAYLKNADGSYKYDVLYFGAWDAFASQDLSAVAETKTDAFIKTGRGVLFGHDTMVDNDTISMPNFFKLAHYCDIQTIPHYTVLGSSQIKVSKKGLLTNYPWTIGGRGHGSECSDVPFQPACFRGCLDDVSAAVHLP